MTITNNDVSLNPIHDKVYWIQHYVIKFVSEFRQVSGFIPVSSTNKTDRHDITEILLKGALNTKKPTNPWINFTRNIGPIELNLTRNNLSLTLHMPCFYCFVNIC